MVIRWILTVLLSLVFLASGGMKVFGLRYSVRNRDRFGLPPALWLVIGLLELAAVVGLLVGTTVTAIGVAAAIGLILLMIGAITTRVRVHDTAPMILGDVAVLALVVVYLVVR